MLLPVVGAGLGALGAYQQSRGDLGATLLGAGLGAVTPAGLRMAGQALGGTGLGAALSGGASSGARGLVGLASGLGKEGAQGVARNVAAAGATGLRSLAPKLATPLGLGALAAGAGVALGAPQLVGRAAGAATAPVRAAVGGGANVLSQQSIPTGYPAGAVPTMDQFGNIRMYGSDPLSILNPAGPYQAGLTAQEEQAKQSLRNLQRYTQYEAEMLEGAKKADFQRNMAAAALRQNIATQAALLQGGIGAAQQMGQQASQDIGRGLTQQYQYQ